MRSTLDLREIMERASELGHKYIALTDVNGLWGFIHFVQAARDFGIQPLAGVNIIAGGSDLILLAEEQAGYENISRIVSSVHDHPDDSPHDAIRKYSAGFFVLAHREGDLQFLQQHFSNTRLFVELRPGLTERYAANLASKYSLEIVATADVYFMKKEDHPDHRILRAIDMNLTLSQLQPQDVKRDIHWFRSEKDMIELFPNSLQALNNACYLAERCKHDWNYVNTVFPGLSLEETRKAGAVLRKQVMLGAKKRFGNVTETLRKRIDYELSLITQKGFSPYFLIVKDIVDQTRSTIGRGSAAASLVSYCLYITQVDPIRYNLQFERFIHPERVDMPDIDVDFPWDERDDILNYIFRKYGRDRSAMVASQVFLQIRSSVREVAKVYGLSNDEINTVTKRVGYQRHRDQLLEWIKTDRRFEHVNMDDMLEEILRRSERLMGTFHVASVHPGGVIIVPDEIRKYVPVLTAPKGVQIVEWEKDQVEDSGLLKIDILGNRSLAVVRDTLKQLGLHRDRHMDYHQIQAVGDPAAEVLMKEGRTMGVFYIESPATRLLLQKAGVVDFEHVVIYSSVIRPAANRFINLMLERIHGKAWELPHPDLEFLRESYGIMVYEEQVSMTARQIAGFGYAESDYIRKVISRPSLKHLLPQWHRKFIKGALQRGYSQELAMQLWEMIQSFSGYSFCKPHSASYAMLSFTCVYLKAHYPAEFLASVISNQGGFYSPYAYLSEARRFGISILGPDINLSEKAYKGKKDRIRMGFMAIQNLKEKVVDRLLRERKNGLFNSLEDFFMRVDMDLADAMALCKAGCFNSLEPEMNYKEIALRVASFYLQKGERKPLQLSYRRDRLSDEEQMLLEIESFGFAVSVHPLRPWLPILEGKIRKAVDIPAFEGKSINLAGVLITRKVVQSKNEEFMEFVSFEDDTAIYECVLFPDAYRKYGDLLNWEKLYVIRGKVECSFGVCTVNVEKMSGLADMAEKLRLQKKLFSSSVKHRERALDNELKTI